MEFEMALLKNYAKVYDWLALHSEALDANLTVPTIDIGGYTLKGLGIGAFRATFRVLELPKYVVKFSFNDSPWADEDRPAECAECNLQEWEAWQDLDSHGIGHAVAKVYNYIPLDMDLHRNAIIMRYHGKTLASSWETRYPNGVDENGKDLWDVKDEIRDAFRELIRDYAPELLGRYNFSDFHAHNICEDGVIIDYGGA